MRLPKIEADVIRNFGVCIHVEECLENCVRREIVVLRLYHRPDFTHHRIELLRAAARLGVIHDSLEWEFPINVDGIHGLVAELLRQPISDLVDLVARQRVFSRQIV